MAKPRMRRPLNSTRLAFLLAFAAAGGIGRTAESPSALPRAWGVGEIIDADIVTPFTLTVFHPEETAALRAVELPKVPSVWRHDPAVADAVETDLRRRFMAARERFGVLIDREFQQRPLRNVAALSDRRFFEAVKAFRAQDSGFPLSTNLAELWALGDAGQVVMDDLVGQLRRFMSAHLRADPPKDTDAVTSSVWIISLQTSGSGPSAKGSILEQATLYPASRYRRELVDLAPASDRAVVGFLAGLLRPNCVLDEQATAQALARRQQELNVVDVHESGAVIARRGERVDARLKRTLDTLRGQLQVQTATGSAARLQFELERARQEAGQLQSRLEADHRASTPAAPPKTTSWLQPVALAAVALGSVVALGWWQWRRRSQRGEWSIVSAQLDGVQGAEAEQWRERALAAEAKAAKATAMLRARMVPHLARWMMSELVQRLLHQRSVAQTSQQRAEQEVAELAGRLEKLQAPLEERRRAYEQRIQQLEAQLAARDRQDHELIRARLDSTRRRLDSDRDDSPEPFAS